MLTHVLPVTPLAIPGSPKRVWISVVDEEYCSEEELGLSMALSTAWWVWGKSLSFLASVHQLGGNDPSLMVQGEEQMGSNGNCSVQRAIHM